MAKIPLEEALSKEIRKAMIDADVRYEQIGEATARAWRYRIDEGRMMNTDYYYL